MSGTILVVAGGPQMDPLPAEFLAFDRCIAADSGAEFCFAHRLRVDQLVGDLDSISAQTLARLEAQGVPIERHRADKDKTDLELALDLAIKANPKRLYVAGIGGGRVDHFLANITTIASAAVPGRPVEAVVGRDHVLAFCDRAELAGRTGQTVSLLPMLGTVEGIVTTGLHYRLEGEALVAGSSRGMSNRFAGPRATVELESGVLLAVWERLDAQDGRL